MNLKHVLLSWILAWGYISFDMEIRVDLHVDGKGSPGKSGAEKDQCPMTKKNVPISMLLRLSYFHGSRTTGTDCRLIRKRINVIRCCLRTSHDMSKYHSFKHENIQFEKIRTIDERRNNNKLISSKIIKQRAWSSKAVTEVCIQQHQNTYTSVVTCKEMI